jgi:hypothetical protein
MFDDDEDHQRRRQHQLRYDVDEPRTSSAIDNVAVDGGDDHNSEVGRLLARNRLEDERLGRLIVDVRTRHRRLVALRLIGPPP